MPHLQPTKLDFGSSEARPHSQEARTSDDAVVSEPGGMARPVGVHLQQSAVLGQQRHLFPCRSSQAVC